MKQSLAEWLDIVQPETDVDWSQGATAIPGLVSVWCVGLYDKTDDWWEFTEGQRSEESKTDCSTKKFQASGMN